MSDDDKGYITRVGECADKAAAHRAEVIKEQPIASFLAGYNAPIPLIPKVAEVAACMGSELRSPSSGGAKPKAPEVKSPQ